MVSSAPSQLYLLQFLEDCISPAQGNSLLDFGGPDVPELPEDVEAAEAVEGATRLSEENLFTDSNQCIALNGFCPVALVRLGGAPLMHNTVKEYVRFEDKVYRFSEESAVTMFAATPSSYVKVSLLSANFYLCLSCDQG